MTPGNKEGDAGSLDALEISKGGLSASVLAYGATLANLIVPTREGRQSVVLGFDDLEAYKSHGAFFGAIVGRSANRIGGGKVALGGQSHQLDLNEKGRTHLHGGAGGFFSRVWQVEEHNAESVLLSLVSPDGDQGYPGEVHATCRYMLGPDRLIIELRAETDRETLVNMAGHAYFNLNGGGTVLDHRLMIQAGAYTPVGDDLIPTGEIRPLAGTAFDFRNLRPIRNEGGGLHSGYDDNFVLAMTPFGEPRLAARLEGDRSGLAMEVWTTEPGLQLYDGGSLPVSEVLRGGGASQRFGAVCLEAQRFPDAIHHPGFAGAVLRPGETYLQVTEYRFALT
ncbi:aldose epimerase [Mesorhizobium sp. Root157]|uniref:aldose epimerase family protein n=1 Tax=Mesorhizobium sp. Root157 TaxID=1736477 RepID=UPI0006F1C7CC|nr:aldose epimerase family protein [Mesorhizobium sp. Root157]KQZ96592.1 aldose epimerase [Mesorhizobium sp. Root157]